MFKNTYTPARAHTPQTSVYRSGSLNHHEMTVFNKQNITYSRSIIFPLVFLCILYFFHVYDFSLALWIQWVVAFILIVVTLWAWWCCCNGCWMNIRKPFVCIQYSLRCKVLVVAWCCCYRCLLPLLLLCWWLN